MLHRLCLDGRNICIPHKFVTIPSRSIETCLSIIAYLGFQFLRDHKDCGYLFFPAAGTLDIVLKLDKTPNFSMAEQDRIKNNFFGKFICTCLYHHHSIIRASYSEIQLRNSTLLFRGIDNERAIDIANTNARNRPHKRNIGYSECTGGTKHCSDFRRIILFDTQDRRHNLNVIPKAIGK